jgi:hypothetical protein
VTPQAMNVLTTSTYRYGIASDIVVTICMISIFTSLLSKYLENDIVFVQASRSSCLVHVPAKTWFRIDRPNLEFAKITPLLRI